MYGIYQNNSYKSNGMYPNNNNGLSFSPYCNMNNNTKFLDEKNMNINNNCNGSMNNHLYHKNKLVIG